MYTSLFIMWSHDGTKNIQSDTARTCATIYVKFGKMDTKMMFKSCHGQCKI